MRKSFALGLLFLSGCGSVSGDAPDRRDADPDSNASANDARPLDGPASEATVDDGASIDDSAVDAGSMPPTPDASTDDARRPDSGGNNDAGSTIDVSVDSPPRVDGSTPDTSVVDAPRMDSPVGTTDAPRVDVRTDAGGSTPDAGGTVDVAPPPVDAIPPRDVANDPGCIAETDQQLCARLGKTCEAVNGIDNCGTQRTASCGTCTLGKACVDQVCQTPVCPSFTYNSAVFPQFSITGVQEYIVGASPNHQSVVYVQSPVGSCPATPIYLADETSPGSGTYTSRDITGWWTSNSAGWASIMQGGLTMITSSADAKVLGEASRSALQLIDFGPISSADYAAVNGFLAGTSGTFGGTAISTNGLELYYGITGINATSDGVYRSTRSAIGGAFSVGQKILSIDSTYQVSAISSDRLTLFLTANWAGYVFTRNSTSVEFTNPNGSNPPPQIQGWQHKPGPNCALFATYSPGGCLNQEVMYMTRQ